MPKPVVVLLHALGSSSAAFGDVIAALGPDIEPLALDLPGFGDAAPIPSTSVADTVDAVIAAIAARAPARFLLVGHSMGGKIATIVARRVLSGAAPLFGLAGVITLAGSTAGPEPMDEQRRAEMIGWARDGRLDAQAARTFLDANVGAPLPPGADALAVADLRRTSREGWLAWLERGSREDWRADVGTLDTPALIVAGGADGDLGPDAQRDLNGAVYPRARFATLDGAGHLLPLERPAEVAELIMTFWRQQADLGPTVPDGTATMIAGPRVSSRTRGILAGRALADDPDYAPSALDAAQLATLRLFAGLVVPQDGAPIDLAVRVDAQLARGDGDGWRSAILPPDVEAYRRALDALSGLAALDPPGRQDRLTAVAAGEVAADGLTGAQFAAWFEDAVTDLTRQWLAHPATMARIGFDGFANGGDAPRKQGWQRLGAGEVEAWEHV